ncbi:hypothetical protein V6N12_075847 [Hibiscus sabdariffa]|uniref:Uncharacterized protein n=1 Tax=Hibiscus sabdariffa TaxID=183260 RepID=A0ABR2BED2_9ROSI
MLVQRYFPVVQWSLVIIKPEHVTRKSQSFYDHGKKDFNAVGQTNETCSPTERERVLTRSTVPYYPNWIISCYYSEGKIRAKEATTHLRKPCNEALFHSVKIASFASSWPSKEEIIEYSKQTSDWNSRYSRLVPLPTRLYGRFPMVSEATQVLPSFLSHDANEIETLAIRPKEMQPSPYFTRFNSSSYCDVEDKIPGLRTRAIRGHMKAVIENPPTARLRAKITTVLAEVHYPKCVLCR